MLLSHVNDVFGPNALRHAVFYKHSPALRFELAGGETPLDRFSQAYDRARRITARAFSGAGQVTVILGLYVVDGQHPWTTMLRAARACGVEVPVNREHTILPPEEGTGEELARSLVAFEVGIEVLPRLLWGALAQELGVRPRLAGELYLAEPASGVLLHPYDDRGMDAIGPNLALLSTLYWEFQDWLLEHDLKRIDSFFTGANPI